MVPLRYSRATHVGGAIETVSLDPNAKFLGGGTNLIDLLKLGVEQSSTLVDVTRILPQAIERQPTGGLRLGAGARNAVVAQHPIVREHYPVLSQALLAGASPQLRNMATVGGNLLQRTRCAYFTDVARACNKREPGSGCDALTGFNRMHAILGASEHCIATHPSDMGVALAALDATIHVKGPGGSRAIAISDFHRLPGRTPDIETVLARDELIIAIDLPPPSPRERQRYTKVRDRASYAFALVSVAALVVLAEDGTIRSARLALGGVAHKPWRAIIAEQRLLGAPPTSAAFEHAAAAELVAARVHAHNGFKVALAKRTIVRALSMATGEAA